MGLGDEEILRRIYVVFQDRNWTARPWRIDLEDVEDLGDGFQIRLQARGTFDAEPFTWSAEISGTADGTITYAITGQTTQPFLRNRLGICVLHPVAGYAGRECTVTHSGGSITLAAFPDVISPHQPFMDVASMTWPVPGGLARVDFTGAVFETEDHRNWSDASYKTYCTPISLPFPVEVQPGDVVSQSVTLTLADVAAITPRPLTDGSIEITVGAAARPMPSVGVHVTEPPWTQSETDFLRSLTLGHLHADIDATAPDAADRVADVMARARTLGARALLALHTTADPDASLSTPLHDAGDTLAGIWIVRADEKVTSRATIDAWRSALGPDLPWGCGTNLYFTELNRQPPGTTGLDWTTFSVNPQVHAWDDRSVLQNSAALEVIASNIPRLSGTTRVHVGPITLKPRFNPNATDPASDVSSTDLPADVDARQRTWLAAAWTALALRSLATPGGVSAVTFFDDLGWKGLRARDSRAEDPAFAARPGEEFPVADVMRDLSAATHVLPAQSSDPEIVDAVVLEGPNGRRAILINLTAELREARLVGAADAVIPLAPHDVVTIDLPRRNP